MKEAFREKVGLNKANLAQLNIINAIIVRYQAQGYKLTLRQLYYQLVTQNIIRNDQKEYAKLSGLLVKGRMAGIVDWNAIEDRVRIPDIPGSWDSPADILESCARQFRRNRLADQDVYIEVWVEKDALSGVLKRVTQPYHVHLMVNRGYSSASAMYDSYKRFADAAEEGKALHILYLGDHDPSGLDMIRDIRDRLLEFGVELTVTPIALTTAQVRQYNPPPNPAKFSDPRATGYVESFGRMSWEVDALKPEILHKLVEDAIKGLIDLDKYKAILAKEEDDKERISEYADQERDRTSEDE